MTSSETIELYRQYVIGNYTRLPIVFVRGEGSHLWDADGRRYIDLFPGWGVDGLGHCHPRVVAAIREQAGKLLHVANNYYMEPQARFAQMISERSFGGKCFFCNSGAESNEGAMKLARLATHAAAGKSRWKFITFENSFHGRTLAAISATAQPKYHKGFEPIVPGFLYAPFNDLKAVEALVDKETCAILVEPIQGEGGVNVATPEFLQGLRKICDREGMILIFDEVQTGCGRTGKWFGYQHYGVTPDIMTLSKMLGGGAVIGALVAQPKVADKLAPGTHASTFGGNPLACAAGIATFEAIEEENLLQNTVAVGRHTTTRLLAMKSKFPFIREVRGKGLMIGMDLDRPGKDVVARCLAEGLLINCTHDTVIRMLPAMTISREIMDEGLDILENSLAAEK
ncbi:MAG: aspartate aminotransferase family protein [Candidatus Brocadiia bacterium]